MNNSDSTGRPKAASIIGPGWKIIVLATYFVCIGSLPIMQFGIVYNRVLLSAGVPLSVVESECEALVISEVGAITAEELVARIQIDQRR